jgi:hypothetical protein
METKFKINSIKVISTWCYKLDKNIDCTICRTNLNLNSIYAQEKGTDSYVVSGMCGHSYHYECIDPWIKTNSHCPICSNKWAYQK